MFSLQICLRNLTSRRAVRPCFTLSDGCWPTSIHTVAGGKLLSSCDRDASRSITNYDWRGLYFMSIGPQLCRRAVRRGFVPPTEHVWISDEILSAAWHRFQLSQCQRRNGSSVPGPLEALRRSSKRRMVGLATPSTLGNLDFGAILGAWPDRDRTPGQWQPPVTPKEPGIGDQISPRSAAVPFH